MDFINSCAVIIYGFAFGMSLTWWIDYYLNNKKDIKNQNLDVVFNEIKFMKIQLDIFKAKLAILDKEYNKKHKQT